MRPFCRRSPLTAANLHFCHADASTPYNIPSRPFSRPRPPQAATAACPLQFTPSFSPARLLHHFSATSSSRRIIVTFSLLATRLCDNEQAQDPQTTQESHTRRAFYKETRSESLASLVIA